MTPRNTLATNEADLVAVSVAGHVAHPGFPGLPAEPYGFSNNATAIMSPPKWEKAKFTVGTSAVTQTIKLR